jgi:hypothetical protein
MSRGKAGKAFLTLGENESPAVFMPAPTAGEIACVTKDGRTLVFNIEEIRLLAKGRGLKLIDASPRQNSAGRHPAHRRRRSRQAEGRTPGNLPR